MNDLKRVLDAFKRRSRYHRDAALEARKDKNSTLEDEEFNAAIAAINEAIESLQALGVPDPQSTERASEAEIVIANQMADCRGILGGIYRAQGRHSWSNAIAEYDKGYIYESSTRFNILSTYNRVNRLVLRILKDPKLLSDPAPIVENIEGSFSQTMPELLSETDNEIERQLRNGRTDRVWALADLAMVRLLGNSPNVDVALDDFDKSAGNDVFPYESMLKVIRELVAQKLPMQSNLISVGERLRAKLPLSLQGKPLSLQSVTA